MSTQQEALTCVYNGSELCWGAIDSLEMHEEYYHTQLLKADPSEHTEGCSFHDCYEILNSDDDADPNGGEVVEFEYEYLDRETYQTRKETRIVQLPKDPLDRQCDCYENCFERVWYSDKEFVFNRDAQEWEPDPTCTLLMVYNRNENTLQLTKSPETWMRASASMCYPFQTDSGSEGGWLTFKLPDEYIYKE